MNDILNYLADAEGTTVHYNRGEKDITSPYGVYRSQHPNAAIFTYIDEVARSLGNTRSSRRWTRKDIKRINDKLDMSIIDRLAIEFYEDFLKSLHLDIFSKESTLAAFSLYTNGPLLMWKSVQSTINKFDSNGWIGYEQQSVDGQYGSKTRNGLIQIQELCTRNSTFGYLFEALLISHMQLEYARLAVANPGKYLKYLNGWNNRVTKLLKS